MRYRNAYKTPYRGKKKRPAWVWLLLCVAATLLVTVSVGNLLKHTLDDETYQKLLHGPERETEQTLPTRTQTTNLRRAYPYTLGEPVTALGEATEATVCLNTRDGVMSYTSELTEHLGLESKRTVLAAAMEQLVNATTAISGVFTPQTDWNASLPVIESDALRDAALLSEFFRHGGTEVTLLGLPITETGQETAVAYLAALRKVLNDAPIAAAVTPEQLTGETAWLRLGELTTLCDFLVLDITDVALAPEVETKTETTDLPTANDLLAELDFYLKQYRMRLLFDKEQPDILDRMEFSAYSYMIMEVSK